MHSACDPATDPAQRTCACGYKYCYEKCDFDFYYDSNLKQCVKCVDNCLKCDKI